MSYYPAERRGGCMESISRCCREAYVYPVDTRKLLYVAGGVVGVILVAVVWTGLSSSDDSSPLPQPFKGSTVLQEAPLIVGCNFFPSNLRDLVHNNVSSVKFDENLKNDSVFGNEHCKSCQTDLPRLKSGLVGSQVWSINVPCNAEYKDAVAITLEQVDAMSRLVYSYPNKLALVKYSSELPVDFKRKEVSSILAVTSGHSIDGRMAVLRSLQVLGVRIMAITSNCSNAWASSYTNDNDTGLSTFGKDLVKEMNRLGIVIDLSESSHQTQLDVLSITKAPVIFSHAAAYSLVNETRNIKDDVLDLLKNNTGVLMVTFVQQYISSNLSDATIEHVIEHINYIKNKTGVTGVGIGAEFDASGVTYPASLSDVSTFPTLFDQLSNTWGNQDDLKNLAGGNLLRVLQEVEKYAKESESAPADETYSLQETSSCYTDYNTRNSDGTASETTVTNKTVANTTMAQNGTKNDTAPSKDARVLLIAATTENLKLTQPVTDKSN